MHRSKDTKVRVTQEDLINRVGDIWYDDELISEMVSKSLKITEFTLALDESEDKMFIGHNPLIEDGQVMDEQLEQSTE